MKKRCIIGYPLCAQWRFWSGCAKARSLIRILTGHTCSKVQSLTSRLIQVFMLFYTVCTKSSNCYHLDGSWVCTSMVHFPPGRHFLFSSMVHFYTTDLKLVGTVYWRELNTLGDFAAIYSQGWQRLWLPVYFPVDQSWKGSVLSRTPRPFWKGVEWNERVCSPRVQIRLFQSRHLFKTEQKQYRKRFGLWKWIN